MSEIERRSGHQDSPKSSRAESLTKKTIVAEEQWRSVSARKTVKKAGWAGRDESEGE